MEFQSAPIFDIRDWSVAERLELRPDFQRRAVWSAPARVMLMDTILRDFPMPKIFLANTLKEGNTYRVVIDGQQRINAILDFLRDRFSLEEPYTGNEKGRRFSELDQETRDHFLSYQIDFNEAVNPSEDEVREVYARVNKYTVPLTKQELRRADFPGDFLEISEELAVNKYFDTAGIFTPANRRHYADVEYVSELLAAMIGGIQDKRILLCGLPKQDFSLSRITPPSLLEFPSQTVLLRMKPSQVQTKTPIYAYVLRPIAAPNPAVIFLNMSPKDNKQTLPILFKSPATCW